jgi:hypothetical protein
VVTGAAPLLETAAAIEIRRRQGILAVEMKPQLSMPSRRPVRGQ